MTDDAKQARRHDWRIYKTSAEMDDLLEETGGEVTPEYEALEAKLAEDLDGLADVAVAMLQDAKAREKACADEARRIAETKAFHLKRQGLAKRMLRVVAAEKGPKFAVGTFRVSIQRGREKAVEVVPVLELTAEQREDLARRDLLTWEAKVSKTAVLKELKSGVEVPGFECARGASSVVVK